MKPAIQHAYLDNRLLMNMHYAIHTSVVQHLIEA